MSPQPRPHRGGYFVPDGIVVVTASRDRLLPRRGEPAVLDEAVIDVDADDLSERHIALRGMAVEIAQIDDLQEPAFKRAWRGGNPRRPHQARGRGIKARLDHLIDPARK